MGRERRYRWMNGLVQSTRSDKLLAPDIICLVARQRLFRKIEQAPSKGIIWITAPPGAGKYSLAATWLYSGRSAARHGQALWYSMDDADADPVIFFGTLAAAVAALPDRPRGTLPRLTPEALPNLTAFARNWFKALLETTARAPYLFAFDDAHRLPPNSPVVEVLAVLAGSLLAQGRLLCLSRDSPSELFLSTLPRKRLAVISDLQVEAGEWVDFERDVPRVRGMNRATFTAMVQHAGRWIADLVVAPSQHLSLHDLRIRSALGLERLFASYGESDRRPLLETAFLQIG